MVATAKGVTIVPTSIKSLGVAVSSVKSRPEDSSGKGEQRSRQSGIRAVATSRTSG